MTQETMGRLLTRLCEKSTRRILFVYRLRELSALLHKRLRAHRIYAAIKKVQGLGFPLNKPTTVRLIYRPDRIRPPIVMTRRADRIIFSHEMKQTILLPVVVGHEGGNTIPLENIQLIETTVKNAVSNSSYGQFRVSQPPLQSNFYCFDFLTRIAAACTRENRTIQHKFQNELAWMNKDEQKIAEMIYEEPDFGFSGFIFGRVSQEAYQWVLPMDIFLLIRNFVHGRDLLSRPSVPKLERPHEI